MAFGSSSQDWGVPWARKGTLKDRALVPPPSSHLPFNSTFPPTTHIPNLSEDTLTEKPPLLAQTVPRAGCCHHWPQGIDLPDQSCASQILLLRTCPLEPETPKLRASSAGPPFREDGCPEGGTLRPWAAPGASDPCPPQEWLLRFFL